MCHNQRWLISKSFWFYCFLSEQLVTYSCYLFTSTCTVLFNMICHWPWWIVCKSSSDFYQLFEIALANFPWKALATVCAIQKVHLPTCEVGIMEICHAQLLCHQSKIKKWQLHHSKTVCINCHPKPYSWFLSSPLGCPYVVIFSRSEMMRTPTRCRV